MKNHRKKQKWNDKEFSHRHSITALKAERDEAVNGLAEIQAMLEKKAKTVSKPFNMKRETFKQKEAVKTVFSKDTLKQINLKKK